MLACAIAAVLAASTLRDGRADWLQFRGPNGNGTVDEPGAPAKLDTAESIAWTADLPGRGLSGPVIAGDRVFVTAASGPGQELLHVICFDAGDGAKRWERTFWATGRTMSHKKTCVAAPSPASDGERIYALFSSNDLVCLDLEGNLLWLRGLTHDYPNASNSLGLATSLVIAGGVLVAQIENDSESFAAGIDLENGENLWKIPRPKQACWATPVVMKGGAASREIVALQGSAGVDGIDPATGSVLWSYADGAATIPSSAVSADGGVLFVPSHGLTALQPAPEGNTVRQLWRDEQQQPGTASPLALGERVYTVNNAGVLTCADVKTGERLWRLRLKGPYAGSPVAAGPVLYFFNERGEGQAVDVSGAEGKIQGEINLDDTILCTPAIAGGAIYVRSDARLWKIGGK